MTEAILNIETDVSPVIDSRVFMEKYVKKHSNWQIGFVGCLTTCQHRKLNLCQLRGKETGSVG